MRNESRNVKGNIPGKQEDESKSVISRQIFLLKSKIMIKNYLIHKT